MGHLGRAIHLPCMSDITAMDGALVETTVRSASAGDETAFAWLVTQHHASMVRVAWVIADDPDTALDAVQSAWGIAWRELHRLREPERVGSWLVAIAANEAREAMRRRRRRSLTEIPIESERDDASRAGDVDRRPPLRLGIRGTPPDCGEHPVFAQLLAQHDRQEGRIHPTGIAKQDRRIGANEGA